MDRIKLALMSIAGAIGSSIASSLVGGWDKGIKTLVIFQAIDYIMGLIVAGVFHKSKKTPNGKLKSDIGWMGICKKIGTLFMVLVAAQLDLLIGWNMIRDGVVIAFIVNETISITENAGLMGIHVPKIFSHAIDVLTDKNDKLNK